MKKVVNVSLAGRSFTLEEDAYKRLTDYLEHYKARLTVTESQKAEVMEDIEGRVADTPAKKCQLRGLAPTPENMSRFTTFSR